MRLVGFVRDRFGVEIPIAEMIGDNFRDLTAIATLVTGLARPEVHSAGR